MESYPTRRDEYQPNRDLPKVDDTYVLDGSSGLYKPKSITEQDQRKGRTYRIHGAIPIRRDWLVIILSVLTLIVVGTYTEYARRQWIASEISAKATQDAARSAKHAARSAEDSVTLARNSTHLDQRAWLTVNVLDNGDKKSRYPVDLTVLNTGRTPAENIQIDVVIEVVPSGISPKFDYTVPHNVAFFGALFPQHPQPITGLQICEKWIGTGKSRIAQPRDLTLIEKLDLRERDSYLALYINATYDDVFGGRHWMHFCSALTIDAVSSKFIDYRACTEYQRLDHENP
jgi:hypothetical protein